jgi:hypothetical protein
MSTNVSTNPSPTPAPRLAQSMLLDTLMPEFDAVRVEHRVIAGSQSEVYDAAIHADLVDAMRRSRVVRGLFALRGAAERVAATIGGSQAPPVQEPVLRLAEMTDNGDWVKLGADPPNEFVFGAIGRFWGGETKWEQSESSAFASFRQPGYAKIAANLSFRPYGETRTLLSYEARTQATGDAARRAFLRYWAVASPGAGLVMRSALALIAHEVHSSSIARV